MSEQRDPVTKGDVEGMHEFEVAVRLVDASLLTPGGPASDGVYQALVARYRDDESVVAAVDQVALARGIEVVACEPGVGLILKAKPHCRLAQTISRIPMLNRSPDFVRAAVGAGIPFVAAAFYPTAESLQDPNRKPPPKSPLEIAQDFSDACKALEGQEDAREPGEEDHAGDKVWRAVLDLPEMSPAGPSKRRSLRPETRLELIQGAISLMVDWGYLRELGDPEGRVYPTKKLAFVVQNPLIPYFYGVARKHAHGMTEKAQ